MDKRKVVIYLNDKSYEREFDIDYIINTFPQKIRNAFINGSYHIEANVSEEVFESYLNYMENHKNIPEIEYNNIFELHLLDNEFHILTNIFQIKEYQQLLNLSYINRVTFNKNQDASIHQNYIAQNLDSYIKMFPDEMSDIPIELLAGIFSHPNRVLENHEAAYHFVTETIPKKTHNENNFNNYFILLNYLQCSKLSRDSILDSFQKRKERLNYMPETDFSVDEVSDGTISFLRIKFDQKDELIQNSNIKDEKEQQLVNRELNKLSFEIIVDKFKKKSFIEFPNFLREIPASFCQGMKYLKKVSIPQSTYIICEGAFRDCIALIEIFIPSTVIEIHDNAFRGCNSLHSILIPFSVSFIGNSCFSYCTSLRTIMIPFSVTKISDYMFNHCSSLTHVDLPSGIKSIGAHAFDSCCILESIKMPSTLEIIGEAAFCYCESFSHIEIPSSVVAIEQNAFRGCKMLNKLKIPHSVKSIGACAFQECNLLVQVENMAEVVSIEESTFYNCTNLAIIDLPLSITAIEKYAFYSLENLKEIQLPSSLIWIDDNAFRNCYSLEKVELPSKLKIIGNYAFYSCKNLINVNFPNSLESIGESAFNECAKLKTVKIPSSVKMIKPNAFYSHTTIKLI